MDLQKLTPWNWLRGEGERSGEMMPSTRGIDPFMRMHREMDRMLEDFLGGSQATGEVMLRPSVDIAESKKEYRVDIEVAGIEPERIDLTVEGDALIISGEKRRETESDDEGYHRIERSYGQFRRVLSLPEDADADNIRAESKNGVLKVRIPRLKEAERPGARKIEIQSGKKG